MSGRRQVQHATLEGSVRGSRPVNGGSKQSAAPSYEGDGAETSKSIRPGRPVSRIVRAVLHELGLQQRRG